MIIACSFWVRDLKVIENAVIDSVKINISSVDFEFVAGTSFWEHIILIKSSLSKKSWSAPFTNPHLVI